MARYLKYSLWILPILLLLACSKDKRSNKAGVKMQQFVIDISHSARQKKSNFIIIPQNGIELCFSDLASDQGFDMDYMNAINGVGIEELFYDKTKVDDDYRLKMAQKIQTKKKVFVADYTPSMTNYHSAITQCDENGFIPFPRLNNNYDYSSIPSQPTWNENNNDILSLEEAKNYLYLISDAHFSTKSAFINAIDTTNYDVLFIDLFFKGQPFTKSDIQQLKTKDNGGKRLVIAYMDIGSAEKYRYYWESKWKLHHPNWLKKKYDGYNDEIWVKFWNKEWKDIIYSGSDSYLDRILNAGFDGVYLDNVEAYYFLYFDD